MKENSARHVVAARAAAGATALTTTSSERIPSETSTHRCIDCALTQEHYESEICPSCGRCAIHCHGLSAEAISSRELANPAAPRIWHQPMKRIGDA